VVPEGCVPLGEIVEVGVDAAVAEDSGGGTLVGFAPGVVVFGASEGAVGDFVFAFFVGEGVVHAERGEDAIVEELAEGFAGDFFDDHGEGGVSGVGVVPLGAGRKFSGRLLLEEFEDAGVEDLGDFFLGRVGVLGGEEVFVVGKSGGVGEEMADGDVFSVGGEVGEDVGEMVVVVELAVVHQEFDAGGGELLGE